MLQKVLLIVLCLVPFNVSFSQEMVCENGVCTVRPTVLSFIQERPIIRKVANVVRHPLSVLESKVETFDFCPSSEVSNTPCDNPNCVCVDCNCGATATVVTYARPTVTYFRPATVVTYSKQMYVPAMQSFTYQSLRQQMFQRFPRVFNRRLCN